MTLKIPVGRIGQWKHPKYGTIKMTQETFSQMIRNFKAKVLGRDPFIRVGHDKSNDPTFGSTKAEGWITDLVQEGEFLFALADPTNEKVAKMVQNKQYRYASPEYQDKYQSKEDGSFKGAVLEALALTNEPFLTQLPEARLLADPSDTFYLDFGNPDDVRKLSDDLKRLADESMLELGYQIVDGKYMLTNGAGAELSHLDEETKKMSDESMLALGYKIVDGKYVL
ncbi:MAG: hypothetical protein JWM44_1981 [Bacilli bacterium]|nr:hypothetical protein [Bacilli bacterium]